MKDPQYIFEDGHWEDQWNYARDTKDHPDPDRSWAEAIAMQGWCGCGSPEMVTAALYEYLRHLGYSSESNLGWLLLAYRADQLGFTEHGGSVYGSWITDAGKRWMVLYEESLTDAP